MHDTDSGTEKYQDGTKLSSMNYTSYITREWHWACRNWQIKLLNWAKNTEKMNDDKWHRVTYYVVDLFRLRHLGHARSVVSHYSFLDVQFIASSVLAKLQAYRPTYHTSWIPCSSLTSITASPTRTQLHASSQSFNIWISIPTSISTIDLVRRLQTERRRVTTSGTITTKQKRYNQSSLKTNAVCESREIDHYNMPYGTKEFSRSAWTQE